MGIRGTVKRSTDGDYIHANVDIDLIISEEPEFGKIDKPTEIFMIAEHFCLGRRRLHLFGRDDTIRPGWVTVGPELTTSNFDLERYKAHFREPPGPTTGCSKEIEELRPKSPPMRSMGSQGPQSSGSSGPRPGMPPGMAGFGMGQGMQGRGNAGFGRGRAGFGTGPPWKKY